MEIVDRTRNELKSDCGKSKVIGRPRKHGELFKTNYYIALLYFTSTMLNYITLMNYDKWFLGGREDKGHNTGSGNV